MQAEFLTFQRFLTDRTLIDGVRLLPPTALLAFEPGRGVRLETTWQARCRARPGAAHMPADALRDATGRLADGGARVGLPLSGGLDSRTLFASWPGACTAPGAPTSPRRSACSSRSSLRPAS